MATNSGIVHPLLLSQRHNTILWLCNSSTHTFLVCCFCTLHWWLLVLIDASYSCTTFCCCFYHILELWLLQMKCLQSLKWRLIECIRFLLLLSQELLLFLLLLWNNNSSVILTTACSLIAISRWFLECVIATQSTIGWASCHNGLIPSSTSWVCGSSLITVGASRCGVEIWHGYYLSLILIHCISILGLARWFLASSHTRNRHLDWHIIDILLAFLTTESCSTTYSSVACYLLSPSAGIGSVFLIGYQELIACITLYKTTIGSDCASLRRSWVGSGISTCCICIPIAKEFLLHSCILATTITWHTTLFGLLQWWVDIMHCRMCTSIVAHDAWLLAHIAEIMWLISSHL